MYVDFEIATLFPSPYSRVKKGGNFKTNIPLVSDESFLKYLGSRQVSVQLPSQAIIFGRRKKVIQVMRYYYGVDKAILELQYLLAIIYY